jgi:hypothetical protein
MNFLHSSFSEKFSENVSNNIKTFVDAYLLLASYLPEDDRREKKDVEFKEFCLSKTLTNSARRHMSSYLSYDDAYTSIQTGEYNEILKQISIIELQKYINLYIPKYVTAFGNSNLDFGTIYFGIGDDGMYTGVPILENFNQCRIISYMIDTINKMPISDEVKSKIIENFKVQFIPLKIDHTLLDDNIDNIILQFQKEYDHFKLVDNDYKKRRKNWVSTLEYYRRPLRVIINVQKIRNELISYILDSTSYCLQDKISALVTLACIGSICFTDEFVCQKKDDIYHYMFWLTKYRDSSVDEILLLKPKHHYLLEPQTPWLNIIKCCRPMMARWVKNGLKYQIIKIMCPGRNTLKTSEQLYYTCSNGCDKTCSRIVDSCGEPCCI